MTREEYWKRTLGGGVTTHNALVHAAIRIALEQTSPIDFTISVLESHRAKGATDLPSDPFAEMFAQCEEVASSCTDKAHAAAIRELPNALHAKMHAKPEAHDHDVAPPSSHDHDAVAPHKRKAHK